MQPTGVFAPTVEPVIKASQGEFLMFCKVSSRVSAPNAFLSFYSSPTCSCPLGYTGTHCELQMEGFENPTVAAPQKDSRTGLTIGLVVVCVLAILVGVAGYVFVYKGHRRRRQKGVEDGISTTNIAPRDRGVEVPKFDSVDIL